MYFLLLTGPNWSPLVLKHSFEYTTCSDQLCHCVVSAEHLLQHRAVTLHSGSRLNCNTLLSVATHTDINYIAVKPDIYGLE